MCFPNSIFGFNPRFRQIHSGPNDHLQWWCAVIRSYAGVRLKYLTNIDNWSTLSLCLLVCTASGKACCSKGVLRINSQIQYTYYLLLKSNHMLQHVNQCHSFSFFFSLAYHLGVHTPNITPQLFQYATKSVERRYGFFRFSALACHDLHIAMGSEANNWPVRINLCAWTNTEHCVFYGGIPT